MEGKIGRKIMGKVKAIKEGEEIVEMKADDKGTYHPTAVVKAPHLPRQIPAVYQFFDGFCAGIEVLGRLVMVLNRRVRR